jgi:hypothetical protein
MSARDTAPCLSSRWLLNTRCLEVNEAHCKYVYIRNVVQSNERVSLPHAFAAARYLGCAVISSNRGHGRRRASKLSQLASGIGMSDSERELVVLYFEPLVTVWTSINIPCPNKKDLYWTARALYQSSLRLVVLHCDGQEYCIAFTVCSLRQGIE